MDEYIKKETFLKAKREQYCADCNKRKNSKGKMVYNIGDAPCRACRIGDILDDVEDFPAADVIERKKGKWYGEADGYADGELVYDMWSCPFCGKRFEEWDDEPTWNFCPNCGARMNDEPDDYERTVEQMEYDMLYEPTYNPEDGSM